MASTRTTGSFPARSRRRCLPTLTFCLVSSWGLPAAAQGPPVVNPANGHHYEVVIVSQGMNCQQAHAAAQSRVFRGVNGHLATWTSDAENQFMLTQVPGTTTTELWIGAYQDRGATDYREPDGGWRWVTGEPFSFIHWSSPGEPNNANGNEDVGIYRGTAGCNDLSHADIRGGYIVEYDTSLAPGPVMVEIIPTPLRGGLLSTGQVTLTQPAGTQGLVVLLASSNPSLVEPEPHCIVPAGRIANTFRIRTRRVSLPTVIIISATANGMTTSRTLTLLP